MTDDERVSALAEALLKLARVYRDIAEAIDRVVQYVSEMLGRVWLWCERMLDGNDRVASQSPTAEANDEDIVRDLTNLRIRTLDFGIDFDVDAFRVWLLGGPLVGLRPDSVGYVAESREPFEPLMSSSPRTAMRRARNLLLSHLTPAQRRQFRRKGRMFAVRGSHGGTYMIGGPARDVYGLSRGRLVSFCLQPEDDSLPEGDVLLTKKLWLESNEKKFRRTAPISYHEYADDEDIEDWVADRKRRVIRYNKELDEEQSKGVA